MGLLFKKEGIEELVEWIMGGVEAHFLNLWVRVRDRLWTIASRLMYQNCKLTTMSSNSSIPPQSEKHVLNIAKKWNALKII